MVVLTYIRVPLNYAKKLGGQDTNGGGTLSYDCFEG